VNAVNTPITYRWISEFTLARKATSRPVASPARTRIPFEYGKAVAEVDELARQEAVVGEQRREPREALVRRVGREHEDRQREGLDEVVADDPASRPGTTPRAICDSTDAVSLGRACICTASQDVATNKLIAIAPITYSVRAAFWACGRRNAVTPFEIDSTPVSAAAPDENALSRAKRVIVPVPAASGWGTSATGHEPTAHFPMPIANVR
jgi:hypothetical protein